MAFICIFQAPWWEESQDDAAELLIRKEDMSDESKSLTRVYRRAPMATDARRIYSEGVEPGVLDYQYGVEKDYYNTSERHGDYALKVDYQSGQYIYLYQTAGVPTVGGTNALTLNVYVSDLSSISVALSNQSHQILTGWHVLSDFISHPSSGWNDVRLPLSMLNANNDGIYGVAIKSSTSQTVRFDEIWFGEEDFPEPPAPPAPGDENRFHAFPLEHNGWTPYTADISSVFDHAMTGSNPQNGQTNGVVTAHTGETGDRNGHPSDGTWMDRSGGSFSVNGQYVGASSCGGVNYLSYDGHIGIDYPVDAGTEVYATADGVVTQADCQGGSCSGYGKLEIEHSNGYKTIYLHLSYIESNITVGANVGKGQLLGESGQTSPPQFPVGPHLHLSVVNSQGVYVDPYGWKGSGSDPYSAAENVVLWE